MDGVIDEMTQKILDWKVQTIGKHDLRRWAQHLRDVVQPQLEELHRLRAAKEPKAPKAKE